MITETFIMEWNVPLRLSLPLDKHKKLIQEKILAPIKDINLNGEFLKSLLKERLDNPYLG